MDRDAVIRDLERCASTCSDFYLLNLPEISEDNIISRGYISPSPGSPYPLLMLPFVMKWCGEFSIHFEEDGGEIEFFHETVPELRWCDNEVVMQVDENMSMKNASDFLVDVRDRLFPKSGNEAHVKIWNMASTQQWMQL